MVQNMTLEYNLSCDGAREHVLPPLLRNLLREEGETYATLEVSCSAKKLYNALVEYIGERGVDLDESLTKKIDADATEVEVETATAPRPRIIRGATGVRLPLRESDSTLSTFLINEDKNADTGRCFVGRNGIVQGLIDEEEEDEDDSDGEDSLPAPGAICDGVVENGMGAISSSNKEGNAVQGDNNVLDLLQDKARGISLKAHRKTRSPVVSGFKMGLGCCKLELGKSVIYVYHFAAGPPVDDNHQAFLKLYRALVLGCSDAQALREVCSVAMKWRNNKANLKVRDGMYGLYRFKTWSRGGFWRNQGDQISRPVSSVILSEGELYSIVHDAYRFLLKKTKDWYKAHGIPYRRSYLFYGPPGTGKTSMIIALAGLFSLNACFLGATDKDFSNQALQDALNDIPERAMLVIEDVDVLFNEGRKSNTDTPLTFSGLLNSLDGLVSANGVITILTTNHIEKLDDALIRGGRVDRRFEFSHPGKNHLVALFRSFYPSAEKAVVLQFAEKVISRPEKNANSIATLQQLFIISRELDAEECVKALDNFCFYCAGKKGERCKFHHSKTGPEHVYA